jgi:hypothetical protein
MRTGASLRDRFGLLGCLRCCLLYNDSSDLGGGVGVGTGHRHCTPGAAAAPCTMVHTPIDARWWWWAAANQQSNECTHPSPPHHCKQGGAGGLPVGGDCALPRLLAGGGAALRGGHGQAQVGDWRGGVSRDVCARRFRLWDDGPEDRADAHHANMQKKINNGAT